MLWKVIEKNHSIDVLSYLSLQKKPVNVADTSGGLAATIGFYWRRSRQ